jgi:pimeloyl-ACP methyl ester carboxylesterase
MRRRTAIKTAGRLSNAPPGGRRGRRGAGSEPASCIRTNLGRNQHDGSNHALGPAVQYQGARRGHRRHRPPGRAHPRLAAVRPVLAGFFDQFTTQFFSAGGQLKVTEGQRQEALELCRQSDQTAAVECVKSFGTTDFREDLPKITVPALVLHGDSDETVPFEGSGLLTHRALPQSELVVLEGAPHGCNVSHAREFNQALIGFLSR